MTDDARITTRARLGRLLRLLRQKRAALILGALLLAPGIALIAEASGLPQALLDLEQWLPALIVLWAALVIGLLRENPALQRRAHDGYVAGFVATFVYSLMFRWPATQLGLLPDLPLILGDELTGVVHPYYDRTMGSVALGYAFHFFVTGALFGSAWAVLGAPLRRAATVAWALGIAICYVLSPLFSVSLTRAWLRLPPELVSALILASHVPYGLVLFEALARMERGQAGARPVLRPVGIVAGLLAAWAALLGLLSRTSGADGPDTASARTLPSIASFARTSQPGDADEGRFARQDSFRSHEFDPGQPMRFEVGVDAPGQPLRGHPQSVAVAHDGSKVYVSLPGNEAEPLDLVVVVDPDTGEQVRRLHVGSGPFGLLMHPSLDLLVVSHLYTDALSVIDTRRDQEVARVRLETPQGTRFYAQRMAWVRGGELLLVANRMTDSLLVYRMRPTSLDFVDEIPLSVTNTPIDTGDEPLAGPANITSDADHLPPSTQGLTGNSNPPDLRRVLRNVNPLDVVVFENVRLGALRVTDLAYVGNVNGLGISIVDLRARRQIGSIDLNSPVLGLAGHAPPHRRTGERRLLFAATGGRFALAFDDLVSELAVVSVDEDPFMLLTRYTMTGSVPVGPSGGPGTAPLVPPTGEASYLSAFATPTNARANGATNRARDVLPELLTGALPGQMAVTDGFLALSYMASDQLELFSIQASARVPGDVLARKSTRFTNSDQVGAPTSRLQTLLASRFNGDGLLEYPLFTNGSQTSGEVAAAEPILGRDAPGFFDGRMPAGVAAHAHTRRVYVTNRLGESLSVFEYSPDGNLNPARIPVVDLRVETHGQPSPAFPATLAEMGEDFYTSSRVSLSRRQACLSCHPNINTDSKVWAVSAAPGGVRRRVQTNRNLRDTPPYGFAGSRSNLEICARNLRSFVADVFFGDSLDATHHAFRDANGDGIKDARDRGRPQADINRDAMYVLERTGLGFEYTSAAIAAFLEVEPRLVPNPFRDAQRGLSRQVPMNVTDAGLAVGDAVRGEQVFGELGCPQCHVPPVFTSLRTFTRHGRVETDGFVLEDRAGSGILDGVVLSHEESLFGPGSHLDWVDARLLPREDRDATRPMTGNRAYPLERALENAVDEMPAVFRAGTWNFSSFRYDFPAQLPCSAFSRSAWAGLRGGPCEGGGRVLANEPGYMADRDVGRTGGDGRNVNVPSLRNTWENAPYLHHGRAATVLDVLDPEAEFNFRRDPDTGELKQGPYLMHGRMSELAGAPRDRLDLAAFLMSIE